MRYVKVEDTTWPVDFIDDDTYGAEHALRYGTTYMREEQRLSVASILSAYEYLTDPTPFAQGCYGKPQTSARSL